MNEQEQIELEELQEEALRQDIAITWKDGQQLPPAELRTRLEEAEKISAAASEEEKQYLITQANARIANEEAQRDANAPRAGAADYLAPLPATTDAAAVHQPRPRRYRTEEKKEPRELTPDVIRSFKLPETTEADRALARKYDYPVVIPGASAYKSEISIRDVFAGGMREVGQVILLTEAHAKNKLEYLTRLEGPEDMPVSQQSEDSGDEDQPEQPEQRKTSQTIPPPKRGGKQRQQSGKR